MGVYSNLASKTIALEATSVSAAQFAIDANRSQFELFEAMLECDFAMALNESGAIVLTEADVDATNQTRIQKIREKINELIQKAKTFFAKMIEKFTTFVKNLVANDKKLWEQYGDKITKESVKGWTGEGLVKNSSKMIEFKEIESISSVLSKIDTSENPEEIVNGFKNDLDNVTKQFSETGFNVFTKVTKVEDINIEYIKQCIEKGYSKCLEEFNTTKKKNQDFLKKLEADIKSSKPNKEDELATKRFNAKYSAVSACLSSYTKYCSLVLSIKKKEIANIRSLFIKLGKYATSDKEEKIEKVEGEIVEAMNLLGMLSDDYVDSIYEECMGF